MADRVIEFFFDIGSSYSYLASTPIAGLAARPGAPVRWRPFLLGGVFKSTGNDLPIRVPAKARWMASDMLLWAQHYKVPVRMPTRFPVITLKTQRALVTAERLQPDAMPAFAHAVFRAYWADDKDPTNDDVLRDAARSAGIDGAAVL